MSDSVPAPAASTTYLRLSTATLLPLPHSPPLIDGLENMRFRIGEGSVGSQLIWREFSHMWRGSSSEVAELVEPQLHMLQSRRFGASVPRIRQIT